MTSTSEVRALAIEIRHTESDELVRFALLVPSKRFAAIGARIAPVPEQVGSEGAGRLEERKLTAEAWNEIDAWVSAGDAGLPQRPAPLPESVLAQLYTDTRPVIGWRVASIPLERGKGALTSSAPQ